MDNRDDRSGESTPRPGQSEPTPTSPSRGEPNPDAEPREGTGKPVPEYPGEGVGSHYPTEPSTAKAPETQADGSAENDDTADQR